MGMLEKFGETQSVSITVLVDNRADLIEPSIEGVAERFKDGALLAEHGFSALVRLPEAGVTLLWDAGLTEIALLENARRMGIDLTAIDQIALSHGHSDHTAALTKVLESIETCAEAGEWNSAMPLAEIRASLRERRIPLVLHPAALRERWVIDEVGTRHGPFHTPPAATWEAAGARLVLSEGPCQLAPGCWTTGFVPRRSFEHSGIPDNRYYWDGNDLQKDILEDDQAIVLNVLGKGLVVLSGCAHAGIVNTVNYAREISGVERVWAVLGGFHLARSSDVEIQQTIDAINQFGPKLVVPSHCTGFRAICQFAAQMPDAFVLGLVGTTYSF